MRRRHVSKAALRRCGPRGGSFIPDTALSLPEQKVTKRLSATRRLAGPRSTRRLAKPSSALATQSPPEALLLIPVGCLAGLLLFLLVSIAQGPRATVERADSGPATAASPTFSPVAPTHEVGFGQARVEPAAGKTTVPAGFKKPSPRSDADAEAPLPPAEEQARLAEWAEREQELLEREQAWLEELGEGAPPADEEE